MPQKYSYFIIHSGKDYKAYKELLSILGEMKYLFINNSFPRDAKLYPLSKVTLKKIIKARIKSSSIVLIIEPKNNYFSEWIKFEIDLVQTMRKLQITLFYEDKCLYFLDCSGNKIACDKSLSQLIKEKVIPNWSFFIS